MNTIYKIGNKTINFSATEYLSTGKGISRANMPQVNMDSFEASIAEFKKRVRIVELLVPATMLKCTQDEINIDKPLTRIAKGEVVVPAEQSNFICSRDFHIADGHHRHIHILMTTPGALVRCYLFDINIEDLLAMLKATPAILDGSLDVNDKPVSEQLKDFIANHHSHLDETYGQQAPSAVPGIGAVSHGTPATATSPGTKGSGDIAVSKTDDDDDELALATATAAQIVDTSNKINELLSAFGAKIDIVDGQKQMSVQKDKHGNWSNWNPMVSEALDYDNRLKAMAARRSDSPLTEAKIPNNNKPLNLHFTADLKNLPELASCHNRPIERMAAQVDTAFSCETLEGITHGKAGDFIMKSVKDEIYPVDQDVFYETYTIYNQSDKELPKE